MVFQSDKRIKQCPHCKGEYRNLGMHVINKHPSIFAQIDNDSLDINDQKITDKPDNLSNNITPANSTLYRGNVNDLVREKLDTMLNIKIIQMLEKGASLEDINRLMQPQQPINNKVDIFEEIKKYREIQQLVGNKELPIVETDNTSGWLDLANNAIPMIKEMLSNRKTESNTNDKYRTDKTGDLYNSGEVQSQITGNTTESSFLSEKSGIPIQSESSDYRITPIVDKRII